MKLIEKKCPNCGASLSFKPTDKEIKCSYCKQEYSIENDAKEENKKSNEELLSKDFSLHKKVIKTIGIFHIIVTVIAFIIIIGVFYIIISNVYKQIKESSNTSPDVTISQIDESTLEMIHNTSISELNTWNGMHPSYTRSDYEFVGFYLYKDTFGTLLSDVFKTTYTNKKSNETIDIYTAVSYKDVEYKNNKVTLNYFATITTNRVTLGDSKFDIVYGYKSIEELYNKLILSKAKGEILASEGMYK